MAQQTVPPSSTLYPQLESLIAPLDDSEKYNEIIKIEKEIVASLKKIVTDGNILEDISDTSILPAELISNVKRSAKVKIDPSKRLKDLSIEEVEEEEEPAEDEEEEDEELPVEDEEDDAGGDYVVSHFDNGEGYEDNDDEGDDMTSVI